MILMVLMVGKVTSFGSWKMRMQREPHQPPMALAARDVLVGGLGLAGSFVRQDAAVI